MALTLVHSVPFCVGDVIEVKKSRIQATIVSISTEGDTQRVEVHWFDRMERLNKGYFSSKDIRRL